MNRVLLFFTPKLGRRGRMASAAGMWALVGTGLLIFGMVRLSPHIGGFAVLWTLLAVLAGVLKAHLVLRKTIERTVARVQAQPEQRCLFSFFSWRSWLLVLSMVLMGRFLRRSGLSPLIIYNVYVAVGVALLAGSFQFWKAVGGDASA